MKKRFIFTFILAAMLALLCVKFMREDEQQPSTSGARAKRSTSILPLKGKSMTPPDAEPRVAPPMKMKRVLVAGGRQWKLNFADRSLPREVQQRIGYDLNLVFGHLPETVIDTLPFPLEVDGRQFDRRARFEGGTNRRPEILFNSGFEHLEKGADESELYVPKSVISAYRKAIDLEKQNQAAYQQLDQFLVRMSQLKEKPVDNVSDFFVLADDFKSAAADLAAVTPAGFAEGWGGKHYREASLLDVRETSGMPLEKYGPLVATTYAMSEGKVDDLPPIVFSNGRWRFLLQRPPT